MQQSGRKLLRIRAAVAYLDGVLSEKTLRAWIWKGQIEVVRVRRVVCIPQDALDELIERGTAKVVGETRFSQ